MIERTQKNFATTISKWLPVFVVLALVAATALLWQPISILLGSGDEIALKSVMNNLGIGAPLAFLALSVVQIVGAPIPGYPVQFLGGALFGVAWGAIYGIVGMLMGGLLAAWLARRLGRPFIEKHVDAAQLDKYEKLTKLESVGLWIIVLLIPLGDFPYFVAGVSRVKFRTLGAAILLSRGPFTFLIAWVGANSTQAPTWMIGALFAIILAFVAVGYIFRAPISVWVDRHILHRLT